MTYCLGILTKEGLVLAGDSRTNAGHDQVNVARKMHPFCKPGERAIILMSSGSLSCAQSVVATLTRDFDKGKGLAAAATMYDAARVVGDAVRSIARLDREHLERDGMSFNVHMLMGGQIGSAPPELYLIYPQGNPLRATEDAPFLQVGEVKYGRPILDRGVKFEKTSLQDAARYALISLDSTMKSNATVGPPIDLLMYKSGELDLKRRRRLDVDDPLLADIRQRWDRALRDAVQTLPIINLFPESSSSRQSFIELIGLRCNSDPIFYPIYRKFSMSLKVGDIAPDFELMTQDPDCKVKLSDFQGKKKVVLLFYPMDFSSVCTAEHCSISPTLPQIAAGNDAVIFGVSCDSPFCHAAFRKQNNISYDLLSDVTREMVKSYDMYMGLQPFNASKRGTIIVGKDGRIVYAREQEILEERSVDELVQAIKSK